MKKSGCLPLVLFVALSLSLFGNLLLIAALGTRGSGPAKAISNKKFAETILFAGHSSTDKIAVIDMSGLISYGRGSATGDSMVEDL